MYETYTSVCLKNTSIGNVQKQTPKCSIKNVNIMFEEHLRTAASECGLYFRTQKDVFHLLRKSLMGNFSFFAAFRIMA